LFNVAPVLKAVLALGCILLIIAIPCKLFAADVLPQPESLFKGKLAFSVKDAVPDWPQPALAPKGAPNVVLILLDDVGFSAASVFGGPVQTPALDQLAAQGLRYNRFHVSAQCSPTRASLLSGRNDHRVGFGAVGEGGFPGYNTIWPKEAAPIAEVLRQNGYSTAAVGKWHNTPMWEISPVGPFDRWPTGLGFEYFYGFMGAAESQWEPSLYRNTTAVEPRATVQQGYHLTTDLTDEAIRWVQTHESLAAEKPYFLYFATGATHVPHHAPKEWIDRYRGQFDAGWDRVREATFLRQRQLGVIPADADLTARPEEIPAWDSLPADERRLLARQMEVYAGFLAHTDHEVGRLLKAVQESPGGQNTLILFIIGDNGASSEGGLIGGADYVASLLGYLDDLGGPRFSNNEYSSGWAWALSTPFQWQKLIASHLGGTRNPLIVSWPLRIKDRGGVRSQYAHVNDVAATLYDVAGVRFPSMVNGVKQLPLDGVSFAESFQNAAAPSRHTVQIYEQWGNRAIYQSGWLANARHFIPWATDRFEKVDYAQDRWELYHLDDDFSQARDIAAQNPQKLKALQALFDVEAKRNNIYPLGGARPLGDVSVFQEARYPTAGKREFVYHSGLARIPSWQAPDFTRSHRITANVVMPDKDADGVIIVIGSRYGGFALYVKGNHLIYESGSESTHVVLSSPALPAGESVLAYEFVREESNLTKVTGIGRLYVNGKVVAEAKQSAVLDWGPLGVGEAFGSPVSSAFSPPFKFSGALQQVTVELQ
jgi:arylsulfatase A-like enzyme